MTERNRGDRLPVLDHGYVELVDYLGGDERIAYVARHGNQKDGIPPLLRYMSREYHTSPFEGMVIQLLIRAPQVVFWQWERHRTWRFLSLNIQSGRYEEYQGNYYLPADGEIRNQPETRKQGRGELLESWQRDQAVRTFNQVNRFTESAYRDLLSLGVARELARLVLPMTVYIEAVVTVDLHNLFAWLELRDDSHAQHEIAEYARATAELCEPLAPISFGLWKERVAIEQSR